MPDPDSHYWLKSQAPWDPTPEAFADMVMDALVLRHPTAAPLLDPHNLIVHTRRAVVYLESYYRAYRDAAGEFRDQVLAQAVEALTPPPLPDDPDQALDRMLPRLWSLDGLDRMNREMERLGLPPQTPATDFWRTVLFRGLVLDGAHSMTPVTEAMLDTWGLDLDAALSRACNNLRARPMDAEPEQIVPNLFSLDAGDGYTAARLLTPDTLSLPPNSLVTAPSRDRLLWCRLSDRGALEVLFELAAETLESDPYPLAPALLTDPDLGLRTWTMPADHPLREQVRTLSLRWAGKAYERQARLLRANLEAAGDDQTWVASFNLYRHRPTGRRHSAATLTRGVPTLLPHTDWLSFVDADRDSPPVITPWEAGVEALGGQPALQRLDAYPPRYRVDTFPSDHALQHLPGV